MIGLIPSMPRSKGSHNVTSILSLPQSIARLTNEHDDCLKQPDPNSRNLVTAAEKEPNMVVTSKMVA